MRRSEHPHVRWHTLLLHNLHCTLNMEIDLTWISRDASVYDVRKSVELVLHGPDLYDPMDGRKPNFEVVMCQPESANRLHNGTAILRVTALLGARLLQWVGKSNDHNIIVCGCPLRISNAHRSVPLDVKMTLEKAHYIDPDLDRLRIQKQDYCSQVRLQIAKIQFGVWYTVPNASQGQRRAFSVEYDAGVLPPSSASITVVYEHNLIRIGVSTTLSIDVRISDVYPSQIGQRETEESDFFIIVKFTSIRKLCIGYDGLGQPCTSLQHRCCV